MSSKSDYVPNRELGSLSQKNLSDCKFIALNISI